MLLSRTNYNTFFKNSFACLFCLVVVFYAVFRTKKSETKSSNCNYVRISILRNPLRKQFQHFISHKYTFYSFCFIVNSCWPKPFNLSIFYFLALSFYFGIFIYSFSVWNRQIQIELNSWILNNKLIHLEVFHKIENNYNFT